MALPWLKAMRAKYDRVKAYVQAQQRASELSWDFIDRAPGWLHMETSYSLFPPPGYELDPAVVRFIKSFCPDYIPTWETKTYLAPYNDSSEEKVTFVRHCIARRVRDPRITLHNFPKLSIPVNYQGEIPNYLEQVLTAGDDPRASDLPGLYQPLDMAKAEELRLVYDKYKELSPSQYAHEAVMVPFDATALQNAKAYAIKREAEKYITKRLDKHLRGVSDIEAINLMCGEEEEIRKGYAFLRSGQMPSPLSAAIPAADPMAGLKASPPKET